MTDKNNGLKHNDKTTVVVFQFIYPFNSYIKLSFIPQTTLEKKHNVSV